MSYLWTTIKVKDLEESINFYQEIVGLKVQRKFKAGPKKRIAFLAAVEGQTEIELIDIQGKSEINIGKDISLGFEVDSVEEKLYFLKEKGVEIQGDIFSPNPQLEFFYVLDPNGVKIQFVENK